MRIAMIHTPLTHSTGGERQILRLAIELLRKGHEVELFTNYIDPANCFPELLSHVRVNIVHPGKDLGRLAILSIGKAIPLGKFDVINCHNFSTNWAACIAKKRLKIPVIWMCNEPPPWYFSPYHGEYKTPVLELFDKHTAKFIDRIVVLDKKNQDRVKNIYGRESTVIRSGIDVGFFENGDGEKIRKALKLENNFILLQVCTAASYKANADSVLALSYLSKKYEQLRLILVGYNVKEVFGPVVSKLGLNDKVLFFSNVSDKLLSDFYSACDVFLFPIDQTWGLVVVEAMAASKPVIVSMQAGVSEIIQDRINGIVVEHGQPQDIASRVETLMNNAKLRKEIGDEAHRFVKENFSWERYSEGMLRIFEEALNENTLSIKRKIVNKKNNKKTKNLAVSKANLKAKCSIIIPTYNKVEYTKRCLASLLENTDYKNYEIIVVDNASSDGTKDFLKTFNGTINVIANNNNAGFARACNQGAKIATGKYLVFLNNDTILHHGWLTEMVRLAETDERIAIVGNKQIYPAENPALGSMICHAGVIIDENKNPQHIYNGYAPDHPFVNKTREFQAVTGSCMLVRKDVFEKLNGFDELYLNSHEDIDFCLKVREAGYKVMYCSTSMIEHHVSVSEGRHDNELRNAKIFRQRWVERFEQDDWKYYQEDIKKFLDSCPPNADKNPPSPLPCSRVGNDAVGFPNVPSMGFLSPYNQKCELATYAQQLLAHYDPSKVFIFAEHGKDILPEPEPINLIRCWNRYSPDYHFVVELVKKRSIPLIHINNQRELLSLPLIDFMQHLYQDGRRIVVTFHSTAGFNMTFKFIDKAVVHTPENKLELIANGCDEEKIVVIPHGAFEAKLVDKYTARQRLNLPQAQNIITSFGFVQENKGIHEIIEAVAKLKSNGMQVKYFILGTHHPHFPDSRAYLERCKAIALRLGVANLVVFRDEYLPDDTILQYLQASDAVIMNYKSNTYESPTDLSFALSACRPLITSTSPMFSIFGDACFRMNEACPPELAIFYVLNNLSLTNYLQKNALKYIGENNWQKIAQKHFLLYAEVMGKTSRAPINFVEQFISATAKSSAASQSIHWLGGVFGLDGYANATRNYVLGLAEIGVDVSTEPLFDGCHVTKG